MAHGELTTVFVTSTVLLVVVVAIALLVIVDQRARISRLIRSSTTEDPIMRGDHPIAAFVIGAFLLTIISFLLFAVVSTFAERSGMVGDSQPHKAAELHYPDKAERRRHFHQVPQVEIALLGTKTACHTCHGDFPHASEPMERTILNMHTQFLGCMTCHYDKIGTIKNLRFDWLNYSNINVTGNPFGLSTDADTGYFSETDDFYSRIVVYQETGELLEIPADNEQALELLTRIDVLSEQQLKSAINIFHESMIRKGPACEACHKGVETSLIPYEQLGFSSLRTIELTTLNIIGLFKKYDEFYLPKMFESGSVNPIDDTQAIADSRQSRGSVKQRWLETLASD